MEELPVETTLYSLSASAPTMPAERRDGDRHLTLFRVGSVNIGDRRELCLIKNISAGGMMIRAYCTVANGERLTVELKSGQPIAGNVTWVRDQTVGVAFDEPIDVIEVLSASMEGPRPRMPRIEVDCHATVREGASTFRMRACDVSQGGIKVATSVVMPKGADVVVTLPGLPPLPGVVRWMEEGFGGITYNRLLPLPVLVGWLQETRGTLRAVG
ncbi:PilZ domain-containing protein [Sphingomonas sp.]|uniref:PilZ domain-containing protein n=1 Tax=Sphingomonas sp. TaxID=28214 RepID=UPI00286ADB2A|nr:PilZ domain-containing protein [Sphingomonas sp.]